MNTQVRPNWYYWKDLLEYILCLRIFRTTLVCALGDSLTLTKKLQYKKGLLLRCIQHFKSDLINNKDNEGISGNEPSSVISAKTNWFQTLKMTIRKCQNKLKPTSFPKLKKKTYTEALSSWWFQLQFSCYWNRSIPSEKYCSSWPYIKILDVRLSLL